MEKVGAFLRGDQAPLSVKGARAWYADGERGFMACGTFDSPRPALTGGDAIRFVYDLDRAEGTVELHKGWHGFNRGALAIEAHRVAFNNLWDTHCARYEPIHWPWASKG